MLGSQVMPSLLTLLNIVREVAGTCVMARLVAMMSEFVSYLED